MNKYYISFGSSQYHKWMQDSNPSTTMLEIQANSIDEAKTWAFEYIGDKWSFVYENEVLDNTETIIIQQVVLEYKLDKIKSDIIDLIRIQKDSIVDEYMKGLYNGLVLALSCINNKEPQFYNELIK